MKKCPFCAGEIEDEAIKCSYCAGMLDKAKDWEGLLDKKQAEKQPEKWYFKTSTLITAFLCIGPFALPLMWLNPRFSQKAKIITTIIVIIVSYYLAAALINSVKPIIKNYQQILNPTF